jgi:DNA-binding MarR family transcriptional regulator
LALIEMNELDSIIHQPARLQIMSALSQLKASERVDFTYLKDSLGLTDGNLGAHLATLEAKGYIAVDKEFVARRPKTFVAVTAAGREAFARHVAALQSILLPK